MGKVDKWRYFQFLVYPESAPDGWLETLRDSLGMYAVSPRHEPEDEDGGVKARHHHVIYKHGNPVTIETAKKFIPEGIPANGYVEPVMHPGNAQRYLIHLDQPEKQQFPGGQGTISVLNGFPLDLTRELTRVEKHLVRERIFDWIVDNCLDEYAELLDSLRKLGDPDMFDYAFTHTIAFNGYLRSRRHGGKSKQFPSDD